MENKVRYVRLNSSISKSAPKTTSILKSFISARYFCFYIKPIGAVALTSFFLWHLFNLKATKKYPSQLPHRPSEDYSPNTQSIFFKNDILLPNVSTSSSKNTEDRTIYKILFWTAYYAKRDLGFERFTCPGNRQCILTFNQSEVDDADAVLFNAVDLEIEKSEKGYIPKNLPKKRNWAVPWIISLFESPEHVLVDLRVFHGIFNWTWSFRRDADIHGQEIYQRLEDNDSLQSVENVKEPVNITAKTKLAAWIVSNCDMQPSNRNYLVKLLEKYISIDIYGDCGAKSCSTSSGFKCYEEIGRDYKFYLAFENSLCVDYTTEKFSSALDVGMVPVLFGFGNITQPQGAFINAFDFETVEELAMHLLYLDRNPDEYAKYFTWRKLYGRIPQDSFLCDVCEKVSRWKTEEKSKNIKNESSKAIEFLWDWWVHTKNAKGQKIWACSRPGYHLRNLRQVFNSWWQPYE